MKMRTSILAAGLVVIAALAGCTPAAKEETSSTPVPETPLAAVTATAAPGPDAAALRDMYLETMKLSLTDLAYEHDPKKAKQRALGYDWPDRAYTMIGMDRLQNIRVCIEDVVAKKVPGDLIECGAWRGGATIFMRAVLKSYGVTDRAVWVADSFEGLPPPKAEEFPADNDFKVHEEEILAVSLEIVQKNFQNYGLLDDQVRFLKGWFSNTLPNAPIEKIAILRADADMYESTMDILVNLYDNVSPGGYIIVDDYLLIESCRKAVDDFRAKNGITDEIVKVDWNAIYWKKS